MRFQNEKYIRTEITIAFITLFLASIFGSMLANYSTTTSGIKQKAAMIAPCSNEISISSYVENFDNWANGVPISGKASGQAVHWVTGSSGTPTFQGSSTVISSGNSGVINDTSSIYSIWAAAEYDMPSPQTPSATNQYWQSIEVMITPTSLAQIHMSSALGYPGDLSNVCVNFELNHSVTVWISTSKIVGTGLTWAPNTKFTLVMQCLSASTSRFSIDGGNVWTQAFQNVNNWTGPVKEMCLYTGAALSSTAYVDNIATSWTQNSSLDASFVASPPLPTIKQAITFTHAGSNGQMPATYQWNFGDGSANVTTENAVHSYNSPGNYLVKFFIQDADGKTTVSSMNVTTYFQTESFDEYGTGPIGGLGNWNTPTVGNNSNVSTGAKIVSGTGTNKYADLVDTSSVMPGCVQSDWSLPGCTGSLSTLPSGWQWMAFTELAIQSNGPRMCVALRNWLLTRIAWHVQFKENDTFMFNEHPAASFAYVPNTWYYFKVYFNTAQQKCWMQYTTDGASSWTTFNNSNTGYSFLQPCNPGKLTIWTGSPPVGEGKCDNISCSWNQVDTTSASFTMSANPLQVGNQLVVRHVGSNGAGSCTYQWNFGDASNSTNCTTENGAHVYNNPGSYTITLWMQDGNGNTNKQSASIVVGYIVENFDNWANGQTISGEASGQHVHWVIGTMHGGNTFQGSNTVIASGNSGYIHDSSASDYIYMCGEFDTPSPQIPSATNQYWQSIDIKITSGDLSQVKMCPDLGYSDFTFINSVNFHSNGSVTVWTPTWKLVDTGLKWVLNTKYTLVMQCLSISTFRFSLDGGKTWSATYANIHNWTGPWKEICIYSSTGGVSTSCIDNLVTSWSPILTAPRELTAMAGDRQVTLNWATPADYGESAITNYLIYQGTTSDSETLLTTVGNVLNYTSTGLINGQVYYFKVAAVNALGIGPNSTEVSVISSMTVPSAPRGLTATGGNAHVTLTWTAPLSNGGSSITNYTIYRGMASEGEMLVATIGNILTYTSTGLTNGQAYYFKVAAVNLLGAGKNSSESMAIPAVMPSAPSGLTAFVNSTRIVLNWSAPASNGGSVINHYDIYRGISAGTEIFYDTAGNVTSYADNNAIDGQLYYYKVSAINSLAEGPKSNEISCMAKMRLISVNAPVNGDVFLSSVALEYTRFSSFISNVWYTVDGGIKCPLAFNTSISTFDGPHVIAFYANDTFGNADLQAISFRVDGHSPVVSISTPDNGFIYENQVALNFTATDANLQDTWYTLNLIYMNMLSGNTTLNLAAGHWDITVYCNDMAGHVSHASRAIDVVLDGILLQAGMNTKRIDKIWFNVCAYRITRIRVSPTVAQAIETSMIAAIPSGLVSASNVFYNFTAVDPSAIEWGNGRIYYDQSTIANQVYENDLQILGWNPATGQWSSIPSMLMKSGNYVEFNITSGIIYMLASTPKHNYDITVIGIITIGASVGIAVVVSYRVRVKKSRVGISRTKKSTTTYEPVPGKTKDLSAIAFNKRARLMQITAPGEMEAIPKQAKLASSSEPDVDLSACNASAREMESQINVMLAIVKCVVHKGPITGFSYTCKHCGVPYCMDCYHHLIETDENCWNCNEPLEENLDNTVADQDVTILSPEVLAKLDALNLSAEIMDEVIEQLKYIPLDERIAYLEEMFKDMTDVDDW